MRRIVHPLSTSVVAAFAVLALTLAPSGAANAYWSGTGTGTAGSTSGVLQVPTAVTVPATSEGDVAVSWTPSSGSPSPTGYRVSRTSGGDTVDACGTSPTVLVTDAACTDTSVVDGTYTYQVTAVFRSWTAVGTPSTSVVVTAPAPLLMGDGGSSFANGGVEAITPAPIDLGAASTFSVFAGTGVISPGISSLAGDLGVADGGTITGFPPGTVGGVIHIGDETAAAANAALLAAYADGTTRLAHTEFEGDQNGVTFSAGVHETASTFSLTGAMTLDGGGDPNAVFIFQLRAGMSTAANSTVVVTNGASAANVFWVVDGVVDTGADSSLVGTILAGGDITLGVNTHLTGGALATGTITLADPIVSTP